MSCVLPDVPPELASAEPKLLLGVEAMLDALAARWPRDFAQAFEGPFSTQEGSGYLARLVVLPTAVPHAAMLVLIQRPAGAGVIWHGAIVPGEPTRIDWLETLRFEAAA